MQFFLNIVNPWFLRYNHITNDPIHKSTYIHSLLIKLNVKKKIGLVSCLGLYCIFIHPLSISVFQCTYLLLIPNNISLDDSIAHVVWFCDYQCCTFISRYSIALSVYIIITFYCVYKKIPWKERREGKKQNLSGAFTNFSLRNDCKEGKKEQAMECAINAPMKMLHTRFQRNNLLHVHIKY